MKQYTKLNQENHKHSSALWRRIPSPRLAFLRGVFLANYLASAENWIRTTERENTYQFKLTTQKEALIKLLVY